MGWESLWDAYRNARDVHGSVGDAHRSARDAYRNARDVHGSVGDAHKSVWDIHESPGNVLNVPSLCQGNI